MKNIQFLLILALFCAGLSLDAFSTTSCDDFALPEAATVLTSKKGTITSTHSFSSGPADAFANDGSSRMLVQKKKDINLMYTFSSATVVNGYGIKTGGSYFRKT